MRVEGFGVEDTSLETIGYSCNGLGLRVEGFGVEDTSLQTSTSLSSVTYVTSLFGVEDTSLQTSTLSIRSLSQTLNPKP